MSDLMFVPKYTRPEVLRVTGLRPDVLQTWVNRNVVRLAEQNPGHGRKRLYSALDIVRLAVMRRLSDFSISLAVCKEIADAAADEVIAKGEMDWFLSLTLCARHVSGAPETGFTLIGHSQESPLNKYGAVLGDWHNMRVSNLVEPLESVIQRRDRGGSEERPMNPDRRAYFARRGIHAEPAIFFPIGEIVNGALAQLGAIDEAQASISHPTS